MKPVHTGENDTFSEGSAVGARTAAATEAKNQQASARTAAAAATTTSRAKRPRDLRQHLARLGSRRRTTGGRRAEEAAPSQPGEKFHKG